MISSQFVQSRFKHRTGRVLLLGSALLALEYGAGCDSTSDNDAGTANGGGTCDSKSAGGPVSGAADMHCIDSSGMTTAQATTEAACSITDAGAPADGGDAGAAVEEEAPVLFGSEGDDDDCKYHVTWTASCIDKNKNVTFNATITKLADGKPLTGAAGPKGANSVLDVYLTDTHTAPNTVQKTVETAPGKYTFGPVKFDAPGKWTVRFHIRGNCADVVPESPHGHVAFFVKVP